jgi:predicted dehydrogenase
MRENDVEASVLVTPNHLHRSQVEAALGAGKDVFVEKPIANMVADGVAMIQKAESDGRVLMVGHNMRFGRAARKAFELIRQGRLGTIVSTEIHFSSDTALHLSVDAWRLKPDLCPLLPVMQLAVHAFDLVHYLVGRIEEVGTFVRSVVTGPGVVDSVTAILRIEDGSMGVMVSNYCTPVLFDYRITGTEGVLRCTPHAIRFQSKQSGGDGSQDVEEADYSEYEMESYVRQMEVFGEAVRVQAIPETDGWVGLQALAVVEAMQRSAVIERPQAVQRFESESLAI